MKRLASCLQLFLCGMWWRCGGLFLFLCMCSSSFCIFFNLFCGLLNFEFFVSDLIVIMQLFPREPSCGLCMFTTARPWAYLQYGNTVPSNNLESCSVSWNLFPCGPYPFIKALLCMSGFLLCLFITTSHPKCGQVSFANIFTSSLFS